MARITLNNQRLDAFRMDPAAVRPDLSTDQKLAAYIGIDKGHLSRVRGGETPGHKVIANILWAMGITNFGPFDVHPEDAA